MKISELESSGRRRVYESTDIFQRSTGDHEIDDKIKNIVMMSPDEYLHQAFAATDGRLGGTFESWMNSNQRSREDVEQYANAMKNGDQFPLPWIDYDRGSQDGRNRALAAKHLGFDKIPVGIVPEKDISERIEEIEMELEGAKGARKFRLENELQRLRGEQDSGHSDET